jgi:hypothetical protein
LETLIFIAFLFEINGGCEMRRFAKSFLFMSIFAMTGTMTAQNAQDAVAEPQYINSFSGVGSNGKLIELERNTVAFRAKTKVLPGYASVKMVAEFKPGKAAVRIPPSAQFIVRGRSPLDPMSRFQLRVLKSSKDRREIMITQGHGSVFGGSATSSMDEGAMPIRFEGYGADSYRITPEHPLPPGEYALTLRGMVSELYCFGVD